MTLDLTGLTTGPAQTRGSLRLVPLLRDKPVHGLRLDRRAHHEDIVDVGDGTYYASYIPHAYVLRWTGDDQASAAYGTRLAAAKADRERPARIPVRATRRMARRTGRDRLRFLPLHLAVEGYLALHFGGPEILWDEWSRRAVARGLSPREEAAYLGRSVPGLDDALRVFEIHPGQCGVAVYVADALASVFVVPHPHDYRALHPTLVEDLYGELVHRYAAAGLPAAALTDPIDPASVSSLADLRAQAGLRRRRWAEFHDETMAAGLLDQDGLTWETVQHLDVRGVPEAPSYSLARFLPPFVPRRENHIGEAILDRDGRVAYLKTFRLSETQVRRGFLLRTLAAHGWRLADAAAALGQRESELAMRLNSLGFGTLLHQHVLDHHRAALRR
ncbi:hypothetical protein BTM25_23200 [Actinomadura rubteroloni]|uniref:ARG and Rhodanese-Phosphatase-superfamily-associated domain-containing protein n=1 Tax=Actinomadura rubteroloni TaxID=1926885 RepID=A0A2P4UF81_9ACTN|nr:hypothetical protein [Actinomadura rubteroloni]POM23699.1 hypothetical protein BTM25_23200 [Actinomadura rubteroloni]